nr:hypothetical protein CFP56_79436 [Quercus suber]
MIERTLPSSVFQQQIAENHTPCYHCRFASQKIASGYISLMRYQSVVSAFIVESLGNREYLPVAMFFHTTYTRDALDKRIRPRVPRPAISKQR